MAIVNGNPLRKYTQSIKMTHKKGDILLTRNRLNVKLAKVSVITALLLGLLISSYQIFIDLRFERENIEQHISETLKSTKKAAAEAAYELDPHYSQTIVDGLVLYESIARTEILDDKNNILAVAGIKQGELKPSWISELIFNKNNSYSVPLYREDKAEAVGKITVLIDVDSLGANFLNRSKLVIISGFVRSLFLTFIFLILFYFLLSKPLLETIKEIAQINKSNNFDNVSFGKRLIDRKDELGELTEIFLNLLNRRKSAETKLKHIAFHDNLTNLPNRALIVDRLNQAIITSKRYEYFGVLLFLDLDNFKNINDALGHPIGDAVISQIGKRLLDEFREEDTIGRLGGDEFIIILPNLGYSIADARIKAKEQAEKVRHCFVEPFLIEGNELTSRPSIGITIFPSEGETADDLLKQADAAMYQAKAAGGDGYHFYSDDLQELATHRLSLERELRHALINNELLLHYQPQCLADGKVVGVEALVRWNHPDRGMVGPNEFIPIAESCGLIIPLGTWVLKQACSDINKIIELCFSSSPYCRLSINVSAIQFQHKDFVSTIKNIIAETGVDPNILTLEVTESIMIGDLETVNEKLNALLAIGVEFSIDDFGTGYSSLTYLQSIPFKELKIDQSFIRQIENNAGDTAIVTTIIAMAKNLKMRLVSEGVETKTQLEFLKNQGGSVFQGYYFSKPLNLDDFITYKKSQN